MNGILVWITGLAGSGKTTIANKVYQEWSKNNANTVRLDGDELREIFSGAWGHTRDERLKAARTYANLCRHLTSQGIHVIISTISLFHEIHEYNSKHNPYYVEIFLETGIDQLRKRNQKKLYDNAENVVGINLSAELPKYPALRLKNEVTNDIETNTKKIINAMKALDTINHEKQSGNLRGLQ